jgi:H+/Cl- antiporter ClcA
MFSPTMLMGAVAGRAFAHILAATGLVTTPDGPLYALLGAAAFFTGAVLLKSLS